MGEPFKTWGSEASDHWYSIYMNTHTEDLSTIDWEYDKKVTQMIPEITMKDIIDLYQEILLSEKSRRKLAVFAYPKHIAIPQPMETHVYQEQEQGTMAEKEKEETISSQTKNVDIEVAATGEPKEEISLTRQVKY